MIERFREIWLHDFEYVARPGEWPDVVCLVAKEMRSGRRIELWQGEFTSTPPYPVTDPNVVFVNFAATAECACHLALGWPLPVNVLDLSPAFRNFINGKRTPEGKGLIGALRYYGLSSIGSIQKDAMRDRILRGPPFTAEERKQILAYCRSDVDALARLLPKVLHDTPNLDVALHHGEFAAVSAVMEHNGVPIDMDTFPQLTDNTAWRSIRDAVVPQVDAQYGVYVRSPRGDWTFNKARFAAYLTREGIINSWPRTDTGEISLRQKTFECMAKVYPQLESLKQLKHTRDKMRKVTLAVGRDGRNRTVLWPFQAKTSRTQPKASKWIFSPAVWLRSLIKPRPGMAVAYIDYSSMEFLIAGSLSDGHCGDVNHMLDMYRSGDPYLAFAKRVGAAPNWATKDSHEAVREKYKVMLLAVQYGMSETTLAALLGVPLMEAREMLAQHRQLFGQYWKWSDDWVAAAMRDGTMWTACGWACAVGAIEYNERTLRNWPIQATGADILRAACIMAVRHGIKLLAPVHDAVLIEAPIERIEHDVAKMREIMRRASRAVLNRDATGTYELRTSATIVRYPDRYSDKRGKQMWEEVSALLAKTAAGQHG